jgi:hypothetical protein
LDEVRSSQTGIIWRRQGKRAWSHLKRSDNHPLPNRLKSMARAGIVPHCRPCTLDDAAIYPSRLALIEALGRGKNGAKSSYFHYVDDKTSTTKTSLANTCIS